MGSAHANYVSRVSSNCAIIKLMNKMKIFRTRIKILMHKEMKNAKLWQITALVGCCVFLIVILWCGDPFIEFIKIEDIPRSLIGKLEDLDNLCPTVSPLISNNSLDTQAWELIERKDYESDEQFAKFYSIQNGGFWQPTECHSRYEIILLVPLRNRQGHLPKFLRYIHPFLQRQQLNYRIVVVEQLGADPFNRGKLFNIGFAETYRLDKPNDCFILHDVDLFPVSELNIYACTAEPRHLVSSLNENRCYLGAKTMFGGACALFARHFREANGFSNLFFGWGGEDDDLATRLREKGHEIVRFDPAVAAYIMIPHIKELPSPNRLQHFNPKFRELSDKDGLSNLNYTLKLALNLPLYTHLFVNL